MLSRIYEEGNKNNKITENTPLTPTEQAFVTNFVRLGNVKEAMKAADHNVRPNDNAYSQAGNRILHQPNVKKEIQRIMDELKSESVATAEEVMTYFTSVMRGEIKDQFGLDAPLSERTKAAQEIAKRTFDIEQKAREKQEASEKPIQVVLNWSRDNEND